MAEERMERRESAERKSGRERKVNHSLFCMLTKL
jgi:hypothetical protein